MTKEVVLNHTWTFPRSLRICNDEQHCAFQPTPRRGRRFLLGRRQDGLHCRFSSEARILLRERLPPLSLWFWSGRTEEKVGGGHFALALARHRSGSGPASGLAIKVKNHDGCGLGRGRLVLP